MIDDPPFDGSEPQSPPPDRRPVRRGIYLLPTLFTVGNLFCGYASLIRSSEGRTELAGLLILLGGVLDGLDGRIARLTGTHSEFGEEFDSLADIVTFGLAPALLAWQWALRPLGRVGWMLAFLFVVCAAMRLARFNIGTAPADKRWFAGLPSPAAAGTVATAAYAFGGRLESDALAAALSLVVVALALLMVSRLRYRSFKDLDLRGRRSYLFVLPVAALIVGVSLHPKGVLLAMAVTYVLSGPASWLVMQFRGSQRAPTASSQTPGTVDEVEDGAVREL